MEQQEIEKKIQEQFKTLPEKLKTAIKEASVLEKLRAIAAANKLHIDQGQQLENETFIVMLGLDTVEHFTNNLKKSLRIDFGLAQKIAREVHQQIFLSIRELLKETTTLQTPKTHTSLETPQIRGDEAEVKEGGYVVDPYREPIE